MPGPDRASQPLCTIPLEYVTRSVRPDRDSAFTTFLGTLFDPSATSFYEACCYLSDYSIG